MPEVPLGAEAYDRRTIWSHEVILRNLLLEQDKETGIVRRVQRPGLSDFATVGAGPIRGIFRQAGTFSGDYLTVSGGDLFRVTEGGVSTDIGNIAGTDRVSMAATATRALIAANNLAYSTDGTTTVAVTMPDARPVSSVAQLNGYFILTQANTGRFYWIAPGETNPDALSFATAESSPDALIKCERVGDELWFFGEESTEVWVPTGDADAPFQRIPGRLFERGCRARDTISRIDNSVMWVGDDGIVYRGDAAPVRMSNHGIEERIRKSTPSALRAWSWAMDGHSVYCLTIGSQGTFGFDVSSGGWSEMASYERDNWIAHVGAEGRVDFIAGDEVEGRLYKLNPEASDDAGVPLERTVTGYLPIVGSRVPCNSFSVYVTTGTTPDPELLPHMRISWSDDGFTFDDWEDVRLGTQGKYGETVFIRRLGLMEEPGRIFKLMVTDPAPISIWGAAVNQAVAK